MFGLIGKLFKISLYTTLGGAIALVVVGILLLQDRPDLRPWHLVDLGEEFTADRDLQTLDDYLALEERLFAELDREVYQAAVGDDSDLLNRYTRSSIADPRRWPTNWNQTFVLESETPRAGVLLLHGMSDSPYSLRRLGQRLHEQGATVIGLRMPGHGTAPSGLVEVHWQDMATLVPIATRDLHQRTGGGPLYIVGYSTGAALAVEYALSALVDDTLPEPAGLVLVSPAIGVTSLAALAVWQARIGHLLGLEKLAWSSILPEYDPYKYNSFAVNAGDQVFRLTRAIRTRLGNKAVQDRLAGLPPILAFQSIVDATVSTRALIADLFEKLPDTGDHELVLFDINRESEIELLMHGDPTATIGELIRKSDREHALTIVTNATSGDRGVVARRWQSGTAMTETDLGLQWPPGVYSLSHVALPFDSRDPLYGITPAPGGSGLHLGKVALRGERGVLKLSTADMLRQRSNPFFSYLESRLLEFTDLLVTEASISDGGDQ